MRVVLQRVTQSAVVVGSQDVGEIRHGYMLLVGIGQKDSDETVQSMAQKVINIRVMSDTEGKMNESIMDAKGEILTVPQFTLYADTTKGNRPSFVKAADPRTALELFHVFVQALREAGISVETGEFGQHMKVSLENDGPVTIVLDNDPE